MDDTRSPVIVDEPWTCERRFRKFVRGSIVAYFDPTFEKALLELKLLEAGGIDRVAAGGGTGLRQSEPPRTTAGRTRNAIIAVPGRNLRLHIRPFHHGGMLAELSGRSLFGLTRPLAELQVGAALEAAGVPVSKPIFAIGERRRGPIFTASIGTVYVEGSIDIAAFLGTTSSTPDPAKLLCGAAAAGRAVRHFHDAGARHPDLHAGNLLLSGSGRETRALVIDLDRVEIGLPPGPRRRMLELMRLHRSLLKLGLHDAAGPRGTARFFDAYTRGDRALRRALLGHLPVERLRLALHRLGYRK